ncbi:hypothetical protein KPH14_005988 [Odynerus spinipes]|uniref:Uncharacterized protein n=1 Tax=Odynerus spinipes TaxID=1348599 RepID=A0AAD9RJF7_9HYME|nr:hypothetical protein KPH14_005988 [Odynerus spinipes]
MTKDFRAAFSWTPFKTVIMRRPLKVPAVRYAVQPTTTATSCLSSRRAATNNETKATATPTQSPTAAQSAPPCSSEKSPTVGRAHKKHVQFPDTPTPTSTSTSTPIPTPITIPAEKSETPVTDSDAKWTLDVETVKISPE